MYSDLDLNLYTDGDKYFLTAYGRDEYGQLDTTTYLTVEINDGDYKAFTDDDDSWYGDGSFEYKALLVTFILYQLELRKNA